MTIPLAPYGGVLSALSVLFDLLALFYVFEERKSLQKIFGNKSRRRDRGGNFNSKHADAFSDSNLSELSKKVSSVSGIESVTIMGLDPEADFKLENGSLIEQSKVDAALNQPIMDSESLVEYIERVLNDKKKGSGSTNKS
jgi:hypothetical protein